MPLTLVTVPCLTDNYAYLIHEPATGATAAVDVPDAAPLIAVLEARAWRLTDILITHHHDDHIQGVAALVAATGARVTGAAADVHRLPPLDHSVADGDTVSVGGETGHVLDVPGHTVGHIAIHFPASALVFTADSLMAMGCGRLFEGTAAQMWTSLSRLAALPDDTLVCSGHEYTAGNARFALTIEPDNPDLISRSVAIDAARARGEATVPSVLSVERATNPFLRAASPAIRTAVGLPGGPDAEVFAEVRRRKDSFRG
jgi:hydroxyacylglutathione hydrolase